MRMVRFRTLGCYPLTGAIESAAATVAEIIAELRGARTSERQGRLIDTRRDRLDGAQEEARAISDARRCDPAPPAAAARATARCCAF